MILFATVFYVSIKNKKQSNSQKLANFGAQAGVLLMAAATTVGIMDTQSYNKVKIVVPNQPSFAYETENIETNNPIQREREEAAPHFVSYGETQRTPGRHGKI